MSTLLERMECPGVEVEDEGVTAAAFDPSKHPHKPRGAGGGQWARAAQVATEAAADGVTLDVTETPDALKLNQIVSQHHGEGYASEALDDLVEYADAAGKPVFLNPSSLGGLTQEQLVAWYRRHGFAPVGKGMVHNLSAAAIAAVAPFLVAAAFNPSKHPHLPKGSSKGGEWAPVDYTTNSALDEYTKGGMHGPAARLLRGNPKTNETLPERVAETTDFIHRLDAQFAREGEVLQKAETVYRGTQIAPVSLPIPGDSWVEPGYTSTTSNIESNYLKSGGTRLIISLPPGTQVLRAKEFNEHETLLPRGAKFTITDIDGDYWHVILDGFAPKPLP